MPDGGASDDHCLAVESARGAREEALRVANGLTDGGVGRKRERERPETRFAVEQDDCAHGRRP